MKNPELLLNTEQLLAVYKYEGTPFHGISGKEGVLQIIRKMEEAGEIPQGERLYPVHRLDMVTSGILLFARGKKMANYIGNEFRFNRISKIYLALSDRPPSKKQGIISGDMTKGRGGRWILTREHSNPAVTRFISATLGGRRPGLRAFLVKPQTGRTHQIRVALKSLGSPILGDEMYGRFDQAREEDRAYLHAFAIKINMPDGPLLIQKGPMTGIEFQSPQFKKILEDWKDPFSLFSEKRQKR